jgi:hypothetical protein
MNKNISMRSGNGAGRSWFSDAIGGAWRVVKQGTNIHAAADTPLHAELRALSAQHFPVLMHKRSKYVEHAPDRARWFAELDDFVTHTILPYLSEDAAIGANNKKRVVEMLDEIVNAEQRRIAAITPGDGIPHTSRFDTSWAL